MAGLQSDDIDYERRCFAYDRLKTGTLGGTRIGPKAWEVILRRPRTGPLFPYLITVREADRATEFRQRALGQNSKIVHRAYAKKAQGQLPSLEDYTRTP